jgi:protein TonB
MKMKYILPSLLASFILLSACSDGPSGKALVPTLQKNVVVELDDPYGNIEDPPEVIDTVIEAPIAPSPLPIPSPPIPIPGPYPRPPVPIPHPYERLPMPPLPVPLDPIEDEIVEFSTPEPSFPEGAKAMIKFMKDNTKYPAIDSELGNQGVVYVSFVVEKDGSITNIEIMRGISKTIDQEAIRVVKLFPKWIPGENKDGPVRCRARLPFKFILE